MSIDRPVIEVFCEGSSGRRHVRQIVAAYERSHNTPTNGAAFWTRLKYYSDIELPGGETHPHHMDRIAGDKRPTLWLKHRFRCKTCDFEKKWEDGDGSISDRLYTLFDTIWADPRLSKEVPVHWLIGKVAPT